MLGCLLKVYQICSNQIMQSAVFIRTLTEIVTCEKTLSPNNANMGKLVNKQQNSILLIVGYPP